ncbi:MAG: YvcK family protein, partial [Candidatus Gracilibacteria bacterium]|nr:YvcK family protein [Candidatus Gracilibacteria bacterium]
MKTNITVIGGGTGTFNVLYGLKKREDFNLAAIISMTDNGGSTGELRDQFGILPPGDIRRAIAALSEDTGMVRRLFDYKFKKEGKLQGHSVGNILLTALTDINGGFEEGIEALSSMFNVKGKVIPVTLDDIHLGVELENGEKIIGETNIDIPKHNSDLVIKDAFLIGEGKI